MSALPSVMPQMHRAGAVRWLSRREPVVVGPSLGEMLWGVRGWHDDFFGDALADQYEPRTEVAARSTVALLDGAHGGVVRLLTGNVNNDYGRLMLGEQSDLYDSLDPDLGFRLCGYYRISSTASILADMFVNAPAWNHIHITADTALSANWLLRSDDNSGVDNLQDSGLAFDTVKHWHELKVSSGRAEHWMDGRRVNVSTTKIPTVPMTPDFRCLTRAAATKYLDLDCWGVVPE